jgi:flagellar hook-associated protein 2
VNDLIPGVTFSLKQTTSVDETLSIGLSSDRSKLSNAISGFIDAYNAVQNKVTAQVGKTAGLLSGDYLVREAQDILRKASSFGIAEGTVKNWSDFGAVSFDVSAFNSLNETKLRDSFAFFKETTGLGSLADATDGFSEDVTGLAEIQVAQYDRTDSRLSEQISKLEDRINLIRDSYMQKLQAADALLGRFDSQKSIIGASVDSLNLVLYGRQNG